MKIKIILLSLLLFLAHSVLASNHELCPTLQKMKSITLNTAQGGPAWQIVSKPFKHQQSNWAVVLYIVNTDWHSEKEALLKGNALYQSSELETPHQIGHVLCQYSSHQDYSILAAPVTVINQENLYSK